MQTAYCLLTVKKKWPGEGLPPSFGALLPRLLQNAGFYTALVGKVPRLRPPALRVVLQLVPRVAFPA